MTRQRICLLLSTVLAVGWCSGCGGETPIRRASVHGTVKWNGELIEDGTIVFVPINGTRGQPVGTPIVGGEYSVETENGPSVGANKIELYANRKTGKKVKGAFPAEAVIEQVQQYIPEEFNKKSETTAEVSNGENQLDYDLKPK
ncbi:MAG: hypothetical protein JWN70_1241 [Planctomycetaceae bacterium]|nr:hypothetical protein [Planctomycetaceae bacterium]